MAYDRMGRKATPKLDPEAGSDKPAAETASATPNAASLARGKAAAKPGAKPSGLRMKSPGDSSLFALKVFPIMAFVAALVVTMKVSVIWDSRDDITKIVVISEPAAAVAASPNEKPTQMVAAENEQKQDEKLDPFNLGKSQIELLQDLADRRREIEVREREVEQRAGLLAAAEHRIEKKIGELKQVKGEIEVLVKEYEKLEDDQIKNVVKIYETMKPKDAARIFNELDIDVLLQVIQMMKASKTAPVLAKMEPQRAKEITARIAERREMPKVN